MHPPSVFFAVAILALFGVKAGAAQPPFGAQGAEGAPNRLQQWLVPSPDPATAAHAVLFRPPGDGPFPLAVIAHASTQNVLRRAQMPQPEYRALSAWLVARGFAVLVPERPGHDDWNVFHRRAERGHQGWRARDRSGRWRNPVRAFEGPEDRRFDPEGRARISGAARVPGILGRDDSEFVVLGPRARF